MHLVSDQRRQCRFPCLTIPDVHHTVGRRGCSSPHSTRYMRLGEQDTLATAVTAGPLPSRDRCAGVWTVGACLVSAHTACASGGGAWAEEEVAEGVLAGRNGEGGGRPLHGALERG